MALPKDKIHSQRPLIAFIGLSLFAIVILNPLNISMGVVYTSITPELMKQWILELGVLAPVFMIFLEALQVLIAPLPSVTMVASGYIFGSFYGTIYSFVGMTIGSAATILVSRKYGRPLVTHFISRDHMERFYDITERHGLIVFAVFFIPPGSPHDVLIYIAGLTEIDFKKLLAVVSLGRVPTLLLLVLTGEKIASSNITIAFLVLAVFIVTGLMTVENEDKLIKYGKKLERSIEKHV